MPWRFNPFIGNLDYYQTGGTTPPDTGACQILLEDGSTLLLESGDAMLNESCIVTTARLILTELGDFLLAENGNNLALE